MKKCEYCGTYIPDEQTVCSGCGAKSEPRVKPTVGETVNTFVQKTEKKLTDKKFVNALILLILTVTLGWLGVHRFMQKKIFTGIIWLLTFGFLTVGWIIDGIINLVAFVNTFAGNTK